MAGTLIPPAYGAAGNIFRFPLWNTNSFYPVTSIVVYLAVSSTGQRSWTHYAAIADVPPNSGTPDRTPSLWMVLGGESALLRGGAWYDSAYYTIGDVVTTGTNKQLQQSDTWVCLDSESFNLDPATVGLNDSDNQNPLTGQYRHWLPITAMVGRTGPGELWSTFITYFRGDLITYNNTLYVSQIDANQGIRPDINPTQWRSIIFDSDAARTAIYDLTYDQNTRTWNSTFQGALDSEIRKVSPITPFDSDRVARIARYYDSDDWARRIKPYVDSSIASLDSDLLSAIDSDLAAYGLTVNGTNAITAINFASPWITVAVANRAASVHLDSDYLKETIRDTIGATLIAGNNVRIVDSDAADRITINVDSDRITTLARQQVPNTLPDVTFRAAIGGTTGSTTADLRNLLDSEIRRVAGTAQPSGVDSDLRRTPITVADSDGWQNFTSNVLVNTDPVGIPSNWGQVRTIALQQDPSGRIHIVFGSENVVTGEALWNVTNTATKPAYNVSDGGAILRSYVVITLNTSLNPGSVTVNNVFLAGVDYVNQITGMTTGSGYLQFQIPDTTLPDSFLTAGGTVVVNITDQDGPETVTCNNLSVTQPTPFALNQSFALSPSQPYYNSTVNASWSLTAAAGTIGSSGNAVFTWPRGTTFTNQPYVGGRAGNTLYPDSDYTFTAVVQGVDSQGRPATINVNRTARAPTFVPYMHTNGPSTNVPDSEAAILALPFISTGAIAQGTSIVIPAGVYTASNAFFLVTDVSANTGVMGLRLVTTSAFVYPSITKSAAVPIANPNNPSKVQNYYAYRFNPGTLNTNLTITVAY